MKSVKTVDEYISKHEKWNEILLSFRSIFDKTEMEECIKWGAPVYTINDKNVCGYVAFKNHVAIWFYQGVFLKDPAKKLINAQEGVTKAMRQWRFTSSSEIDEKLILAYLREAIQNQKDGKEVKAEKKKLFKTPEILEKALKTNSEAAMFYQELSAARKNEFCEYIIQAKQEATKERRVAKAMDLLSQKMGLNDKYK